MLDGVLRRKLEERCFSLAEAYRKLDKAGNGAVTEDDFDETLRGFNVRAHGERLRRENAER